MGIVLSKLELIMEVMWSCKSVPVKAGVTASKSALGDIPGDPLGNWEFTSRDTDGPRE